VEAGVVKHYVKPECKHGCRFLQVSQGLWLCPHAAYGEASYYKGAIEDARKLLEKAGGYDAVLSRVVAEEEERKEDQRKRREEKQKRLADSVRYE
jgi:hypothetical protein